MMQPDLQRLAHIRDYCSEIERTIARYGKLTDFLARRQAPKHRAHIRELLERYGCDDLEGFLRVTHALSLNDTFWVREADSDLMWDSVSLYRNEFDQLVSEAAFDGICPRIRSYEGRNAHDSSTG